MGEKILSGVYSITNRINGKRYVGASTNVPNRIQSHQRDLMLGEHENYNMQADYKKSSEYFEFSILELVKNESELKEREDFFIDLFESFIEKKGYNIAKKSSLPLKTKHSVIGFGQLIDAMKKHQIIKSNFDTDKEVQLGEVLHYMRINAGLSQIQLSEKLGISRSNISKLESNSLELKAVTLLNWCIATKSHEILAAFILGVDYFKH